MVKIKVKTKKFKALKILVYRWERKFIMAKKYITEDKI